MTGRLLVVGIGPGDPDCLTPEAARALATAEALYGYGPYLDRVPAREGQMRSASDNREERARAGAALRHATQGATVAIVSGGDPGVFAMAAAVCEEIEAGGTALRAIDITIMPPLNVPHANYIVARGPFSEADDRELLREHRIDAIVAKNSGGTATYGKIAAARALGIAVIMLRRPALPDVPSAANIQECVAWLDHANSRAERGV